MSNIGPFEMAREKQKPENSLRDNAEATRPLDFDELRIANQRRMPDFQRAYDDAEDDWTVNDWAVAAAGELGELCNLLKKRLRGQEVSTEDLAKELADTVTYLDFVAWKLGIDLGQATINKFNEVSERVESDVRL